MMMIRADALRLLQYQGYIYAKKALRPANDISCTSARENTEGVSIVQRSLILPSSTVISNCSTSLTSKILMSPPSIT